MRREVRKEEAEVGPRGTTSAPGFSPVMRFTSVFTCARSQATLRSDICLGGLDPC